MAESGETQFPEAWQERLTHDASPSETLGLGTDDHMVVDLAAELDGKERLVLGRRLGRGGHSVVHAAEQVVLQREVAVKSVREDRPDADARVLLHEARITGVLEHPNIVPIYDIDLRDGEPRIVLKRVSGEAWSKRLKRDPGDLAEHVRVLVGVCDAVAFAHHRGIIHRDIKPQNVMVGDFGEVYLMDWGIACSLREDDRGKLPLASEQAVGVGTPAYMCPEMVSKEADALSEATNVYLLGGCLRKVLTGKAPWTGKMKQLLGLLTAGAEPPAVEVGPPALRALCDRCLQADPGARPSLTEMQDILKRWLANRGLDAMVTRAGDGLAELEAAIGAHAPREEVQECFGSCRAVYEAVLAADADHPDALAGLRRAREVMVAHAVSHRDHAAARFLLRTMADPPPRLVADVEALEAEAEAAEGELAALRQEHDAVLGTPARAAAVAVSGLVACLAPPVVTVLLEDGYVRGMVSTAMTFTGSSIAMLFAWPSLRRTRANRSMALLVLACLFYTMPVFAGNWLLGMDGDRGVVAVLLVYGCLFGLYALIEERALLPAAAVWMVAFLGAAAYPALFVGLLVGSVAVTVVNALAVYGVRWMKRR